MTIWQRSSFTSPGIPKFTFTNSTCKAQLTADFTLTLEISQGQTPPPPQLARPTGLSLTEAGGDITADWNDVGRRHRIRAGMARGRVRRCLADAERIRPAAHLHAVGSDHG